MNALPLFLCALLVVGVFADSCQENCLSSKCESCHCGTQVAMRDPAAICQKYAEWDQDTCQCAARVASGANANAVAMNDDGTVSVGLFMINSAIWGSCSNGAAPCAVEQNLQCAIELYKLGGDSFDMFDNIHACLSNGTNGTTTSTTVHPTHTTSHTTATHTSGTHGPSTHTSGTHGPSTHTSGTHGPSTHTSGTHGQPTHGGGTHGGNTHGKPTSGKPTSGTSGSTSSTSNPSSTSSTSAPSSTSSTSAPSSTSSTSGSTYSGGMFGYGVAKAKVLGKTGVHAEDKGAKKFEF